MNNKSNYKTDLFESLFKENYKFLCLVSFSINKDMDASKDIVQNFFITYWQKRSSILIRVSFRAYAVKAVKNLSLIAIKKALKEKAIFMDLDIQKYDVQKDFDNPQTKNIIFEALNKLPIKRKEIFVSAVLQGYSYKEISESKGISINTVKTQIKRSFLFLRSYDKK